MSPEGWNFIVFKLWFKVLYEGFRHFLVAGSTLQPRVWERWGECWSLSETNQEAFYMQIQQELCAPCRDERIQMEEHLLLLHPLQLPHHQNMENSWFSFRPLTFQFCSQGEIPFWRVLISSCRHNKSHSIVMAGKRVQDSTSPHQRYLVNRVGSKYLGKCTRKETTVNFFSAAVLTALDFCSLRAC